MRKHNNNVYSSTIIFSYNFKRFFTSLCIYSSIVIKIRLDLSLSCLFTTLLQFSTTLLHYKQRHHHHPKSPRRHQKKIFRTCREDSTSKHSVHCALAPVNITSSSSSIHDTTFSTPLLLCTINYDCAPFTLLLLVKISLSLLLAIMVRDVQSYLCSYYCLLIFSLSSQ